MHRYREHQYNIQTSVSAVLLYKQNNRPMSHCTSAMTFLRF